MTPVGLLLITSCKFYFVKKVAAQLEVNVAIPDTLRGSFTAFLLSSAK